MAGQLTAMNGASTRPERSCSIWAMKSLPEPLSPVISTDAEDGAMRSTRSVTRRMTGERLMTRLSCPKSASLRRSRVTSLRISLRSAMCATSEAQAVEIHRLGEEVEGALADRLHRILDRAVTGQHDEAEPRIRHTHLPEQVESTGSGRHEEIAHHRFRPPRLDQRQRLGRARSAARLVSPFQKVIAQAFRGGEMIIDDEDAHARYLLPTDHVIFPSEEILPS